MRRIPFIHLFLFISFVLICGCKKEEQVNDRITDIDGNVYNTVTIGTQVWMKENLKVTRFSNGDPIPIITDATQWINLSSGAFCYYDNNPVNANTYGILYNWFAVSDSRNICPQGWHVPAKSEWEKLVAESGGEDIAGGKLKAKETTHWISPNEGAKDTYGFAALPGGYRYYNAFQPPGYYAVFWSKTPDGQTDGWSLSLVNSQAKAYIERTLKTNGHAVRCIKD